MEQKVYAILREGEEESDFIKAKTIYNFKYTKGNVFWIKSGELWIEEASTAFDFLNVG